VCLAIPGKIIQIDDKSDSATIDYGDGTKRMINVSLVDVKIGDYVLVHAGFAIEKLNEIEAKKTLDLFREILSSSEEK
jgi:hydrogenase expression/formation protein HypC